MNVTLQSTAGYFSTVAQVSGGLLGLVFVAISFNTKVLGEKGNPALRDLARQTFADFLVVLMFIAAAASNAGTRAKNGTQYFGIVERVIAGTNKPPLRCQTAQSLISETMANAMVISNGRRICNPASTSIIGGAPQDYLGCLRVDGAEVDEDLFQVFVIQYQAA